LQVNYYSKVNRRKRLRRKKVHTVITNESNQVTQTRDRFAAFSSPRLNTEDLGEDLRMPAEVRAPSPEALNSLCLKPQWAMKKGVSASQNKSSTLSSDNAISLRPKYAFNLPKSSITPKKDVTESLKSVSPTTADKVISVSEGSTVSDQAVESTVIGDSQSSSSDVQSDNEETEGTVWSKSVLTAKVRLNALECINTLIRVSEYLNHSYFFMYLFIQIYH